MTTDTPRVFSDMPIPPGEVLAEELEARGMTQKELAVRLGRPAQAINEIIKAKKAITPDTAIGLEKALGISAHFWVGLESDYRMTLARNRERKTLEDNMQWLADYPIHRMINLGWIQAGRDRLDRMNALLNFLGTSTAEPKIYQQAIGFRITEAAQRKISLGALSVWLRKGELEAQSMPTEDYDEKIFKDSLVQIRRMTEEHPRDFIPAMTDLCAKSGVAFRIIQELPKSGANGAARWLTDRKALIQMSLRGKWADIFWFTFFHEAAHLIIHRKQRRVVIDGLEQDPEMAEIETDANDFAKDFLIPPDDWSAFRSKRAFTDKTVKEFSSPLGIAPFIVVGRLQKERLIGYDRLTSLKPRYEWVDDSGA